MCCEQINIVSHRGSAPQETREPPLELSHQRARRRGYLSTSFSPVIREDAASRGLTLWPALDELSMLTPWKCSWQRDAEAADRKAWPEKGAGEAKVLWAGHQNSICYLSVINGLALPEFSPQRHNYVLSEKPNEGNMNEKLKSNTTELRKKSPSLELPTRLCLCSTSCSFCCFLSVASFCFTPKARDPFLNSILTPLSPDSHGATLCWNM